MYTSLFLKKFLNALDLRHLQELIMQMWIPLNNILIYNHTKYDATLSFVFGATVPSGSRTRHSRGF